MDAQSLEELSQHFTEKLSRLCEGLAIQACVESSDEDVRAECCLPMNTLWQEVDELSDILTLARSNCAEQRKTLAGVQAVKDKLELLIKGMQYTSSNIPSHLPTLTSASAHQSEASHQNGTEEEKTYNPIPVPKTLQGPGVLSETTAAPTVLQTAPSVSKQPQPPCPLMEYLTVDEFKEVPKYMKGRLSYQQVNGVVSELNKVFTAKYKLFRQKKSTMSDVHRRRYEVFKMQESKDTKGVYFVVEKDIKEWSSLKMSKETHSMLTILRHSGRMCEIRGDRHIRYAMIEMY